MKKCKHFYRTLYIRQHGHAKTHFFQECYKCKKKILIVLDRDGHSEVFGKWKRSIYYPTIPGHTTEKKLKRVI